MADFISFGFGCIELSVSFCIICLAALTITYIHSMLWDIKTDKIQFFKWLKDKDNE